MTEIQFLIDTNRDTVTNRYKQIRLQMDTFREIKLLMDTSRDTIINGYKQR